MKYYILGFITALSVMIIAGSAYFLGRETARQQFREIQPTPQTLPTAAPLTPTPTPGFDINTLRSVIEQAVQNKSYTDLTSVLDTNVEIRIENQNCCGTLSAAEAIKKLTFLNKAVSPWDFSSDNQISVNLVSTYPKNYANAVIGISTNKYVAAFQLDNNGKVAKISLSSNYSILLP